MSKVRGYDVKENNQVRAWIWRIFIGDANRNNLWFSSSHNHVRSSFGIELKSYKKIVSEKYKN